MAANPLEPLRAVRCNSGDLDPALSADLTVDDYRTYMMGRDPAVLRFTEGQTPVWFVLCRLPAAYLLDVLGPLGPEARRTRAFRAACHAVEGTEPLVCHEPEDAPEKAPFVALPSTHGVTLAPESWVQAVADRFGAETVAEMGQVALDLARLPFGRRSGYRLWGGSDQRG